MDKILFANGEVNANIAKGFLESNGMKASVAPDGMNYRSGTAAGGGTFAVFVEHEKFDEAVLLLKTEGFLK